jgi:RNA-binding protein
VDELTPAERRALRARAHHLQPVVLVGEAGLTPQVLREIERGLESHELIKVRVATSGRQNRSQLAAEIAGSTGASSVQQIGRVLVLYRARREAPQKTPVAPPGRRGPVRRTKRSYRY